MDHDTLAEIWAYRTNRGAVMSRKKLLKRPLSVTDILRWAEAYRGITGKWPTRESGDIIGAKFETWATVDTALRDGLRGLEGAVPWPNF
jgi:hypothetical protein